jgi:hypothetical protein
MDFQVIEEAERRMARLEGLEGAGLQGEARRQEREAGEGLLTVWLDRVKELAGRDNQVCYFPWN